MTPLIRITPWLSIPETELRFRFARSGGPGGQNVNKVSTRVELLFAVQASRSLTGIQKEKILASHRRRITADGDLRIVSDESRSQWKNRETAMEKFAAALRAVLIERKPRRATRATATARERRMAAKKIRARAKQLRGRVPPEQ